MTSPSCAAAAVAAVLLLPGCAGDRGETEPPPLTTESQADRALREVERTRPGAVLQDFVRAAARGDEGGMWERLSLPSRRRLGPFLSSFRRGAAPRLERDLRALGRRHELILSQQITPTFAVAAIGRPGSAYGAALRNETGLWRLEVGGSVHLKPLRPHPGETVLRRTQLAAEVAAQRAIVEAGLWLDGLAVPSRGGELSPRQLTMFTEAPDLTRGRHTVIAFASTDSDAAALAWTFRARS